jgi:hypothetical protein
MSKRILTVMGLSVCALGAGLLTVLHMHKRKTNNTYRVVIYTLPEKFTPRLVITNTDVFIYQHVYSPLMQRDEHGRLTSMFLDLASTAAIDESFLKYRLCLKPGVRFSDDTLITSADLRNAIESVHKTRVELKPLEKVTEGEGCVTVHLSSADPSYFEKLMSLDSTVLKSGTENDSVPVGLGPYRVELRTAKNVVLQANPGLVSGDFTRIEFIKFEGDVEAVPGQVTDWNHLYHTKIPQHLTEGYRKIDLRIWKVYFLLVKLPERDQRLAFVKCFDRNRFVHELGIRLIPLSGFLPKGMPGWDVDYAEALHLKPSACTPFGSEKPSVLYPSYNSDLHPAIAAYFKSLDSKLPVHVRVEPRTLEDTIKIGYSKTPIINLVGTDADEPTAQAFLMNFVGERNFLYEEIPGLRQEIEQATQSTGEDRDAHFRKAHRLLLETGYIVPLGELISEQYYPSNLEGIEQVNAVHGFPQIDRMRIL